MKSLKILLGLGSMVALTACHHSFCEEFFEGQLCPADAGGGQGGTGGNEPVGGAGADGGGGTGEGGGGGPPAGCTPTQGDTIGGDCGVFVSSSLGDDASQGSKSEPVATLQRALELAAGAPVYACGEEFDESWVIATGVVIYGALDCSAGWVYEPSTPTTVAPSARGVALLVDAAGDAVRIDDVAFVARNAIDPGESSIGAFVRRSADVILRRVQITAGQGARGADGDLQSHTYPPQADLNGNNANGAAGGLEALCICPGGAQTTGGPGGNAAAGGQSGGNGTPSLGGGQGGTGGGTCATGSGSPGNPGVPAGDGMGADTFGELSDSGWDAADGGDGDPGGPGQGGGGGASSPSGGGGSGGCGGCGGAAASGGTGGGASIALLSLDSAVSLEGGALTADDAGDGGNGQLGQPGQTQFGLSGGGTLGGCSGGNGAAGGPGGASGGGAGGVSAGVVYTGTEPTLEGIDPATGTSGTGGIGGSPGINDGVDGESDGVIGLE